MHGARRTPVSRCAWRTMLTAPACPQPVTMASPLPRTFTTRAWSSRISGSGSHVVPVQCWCAGGMPCSKSVVRSTSPVIRIEPSTSRDGWRRSITSKPSPVSARLLSVGQSSAPPLGRARRRRVHTSGWTTIGKDRVPRRPASPGRPPAWSKWPWLSTMACTPDRSRPSRSALVTIASGDSPVSNSTDVVVSPRRTVTSAEKPCSATRPTLVNPGSNWGAWAVPAANGARVMVSSLVSRAS